MLAGIVIDTFWTVLLVGVAIGVIAALLFRR